MQRQDLSEEDLLNIRNEVKVAMAEWVKEDLFTKEHMEIFWAGAFDVLQNKAQIHTGKFVVSSISSLFNKIAVFLLLGGLIYAVGGWSAMVGYFRSLFTGSPLSH